jgi:hypothetical protein
MSQTTTRLQKVLEIIRTTETESALTSVAKHLSDIFNEAARRAWGEPPQFEVSRREVRISEFFRGWDMFTVNEVPFDEWSDVAHAALQVVEKLIVSDAEIRDFSGPIFDDFWNLRNQRVSELSARPEYRGKFDDFQGR